MIMRGFRKVSNQPFFNVGYQELHKIERFALHNAVSIRNFRNHDYYDRTTITYADDSYTVILFMESSRTVFIYDHTGKMIAQFRTSWEN